MHCPITSYVAHLRGLLQENVGGYREAGGDKDLGDLDHLSSLHPISCQVPSEGLGEEGRIHSEGLGEGRITSEGMGEEGRIK